MSLDPSKLVAVHARVMNLVILIEKLIPDGLPIPGVMKLDIALKAVIKADSSLAAHVDEIKGMFAQAKAEYNEVRSEIRSLITGMGSALPQA